MRHFEPLLNRFKALPRHEIQKIARMYERRAEQTPHARNNVSATIAIALRLFLDPKNKPLPQRNVL